MMKEVIVIGALLFLVSCGSNRNSNHWSPELDTISFENLSDKAYAYIQKQQDSNNRVYKIDQREKWFYDQGTGILTFSDSGVKKIEISFEEVGSLSFKSNTWLWAWDNPNIDEKVKSQIGLVREYGLLRGFDKLINPKWKADVYDAWEMTAIAAYLMNAKGAYRVPSKDSNLYSFMIYKDINLVNAVGISRSLPKLDTLPKFSLPKLTLVSSAQISPCTTVKINGSDFDLVTRDNDTIYLTTNDKRFQTQQKI